MKITSLKASIHFKRVRHNSVLLYFQFFWQMYVTETAVVVAYVSHYPLRLILVSVIMVGAETIVKNVGFVYLCIIFPCKT